MIFENIINDLESGYFLNNILIKRGLDIQTTTTRRAEDIEQKLVSILGEDAQYLSVSIEEDDENAMNIIISFPDKNELMKKWQPQIRSVLQNASI